VCLYMADAETRDTSGTMSCMMVLFGPITL